MLLKSSWPPCQFVEINKTELIYIFDLIANQMKR